MVLCVVRQYRRLSGALAGSGSSASRTRFEGCVYQRHPQCRRVVTTFLHVCIDIINYSLPVLLKYQRKYLMLLLWDLKSYVCQTTGLFCGSCVYQVMTVKMGLSNSFPESSKAWIRWGMESSCQPLLPNGVFCVSGGQIMRRPLEIWQSVLALRRCLCPVRWCPWCEQCLVDTLYVRMPTSRRKYTAISLNLLPASEEA